MNINLHIERLVLEGVSYKPGQQSALNVAVTSELRRLLSTEAARLGQWSDGSTRGVRGGAISINANQDPLVLGSQIAGAVYRGLGK